MIYYYVQSLAQFIFMGWVEVCWMLPLIKTISLFVLNCFSKGSIAATIESSGGTTTGINQH